MIKKTLITLVAFLALFLLYVSSKDSKFLYERNGVINATPEKIFPYISQLSLGGQWSPYEKKDPSMKKTITGNDGTPGAKMTFSGNSDVGAGMIEILAVSPNDAVDMKLTMTEPFFAENIVHYRLTPVEGGTRFSWSMEGDGGFMGKLISTIIDCDQMIGKDFEAGIANLKAVVESDSI